MRRLKIGLNREAKISIGANRKIAEETMLNFGDFNCESYWRRLVADFINEVVSFKVVRTRYCPSTLPLIGSIATNGLAESLESGLSDSESTHEVDLVANHFCHDWHQCGVREVDAMIRADVSGVEHQLEVFIQIGMSNVKTTLRPYMIQEGTHPLANEGRKVTACQFVGRQKPDGPVGSCATGQNIAVIFVPYGV